LQLSVRVCGRIAKKKDSHFENVPKRGLTTVRIN